MPGATSHVSAGSVNEPRIERSYSMSSLASYFDPPLHLKRQRITLYIGDSPAYSTTSEWSESSLCHDSRCCPTADIIVGLNDRWASYIVGHTSKKIILPAPLQDNCVDKTGVFAQLYTVAYT